MKKDAHFIKNVAAALAFLMLRTSVCGAASMVPGSLAILEHTAPDHEMRTAWARATREVNLDPLLLVLNEDEVSSVLRAWRTAGEAVNAAWRTADKSTLERTQSLLDEAWNAYYAFTFKKALGYLQKAGGLLESPGDSRFRSRLGFEVNVLKGMVHRAAGDGRYMDDFKKAAAVFPAIELSPERYSPEIISAYSRVRDALLLEEMVVVAVDGSPADADILMDGKLVEPEQEGAQLRVFPGRHFVEARASGYEPYGYVLDVEEWDSPSLKFKLIQSGPEGEPDEFFLGRLKAGDRSYLSQFLERLDVDYVLIPDGEDGILHSWLVGRDGRAVIQGKIWEPGNDPDSAVRNLAAMLKPFRQDRVETQQPVLTQMNLPPLPEAVVDPSPESEKTSGWKRYAAVLGVLIIVAVITSTNTSTDSGGGGTSVEVTW